MKQTQVGCVGQVAPGFARWLRLGLLSALVATGARGQEVAFALGRLHAVGEGEVTYAWRMDYFQHVSPHVALSFGWLNEGHLADHHRDGWLVQAWATRDPQGQRLKMGIGLGLYGSHDTLMQEGGYRNDHDIRPVLSVFLAHPIGEGPWTAQIQLNRTAGGRAPTTQSVLLGLALRPGSPAPITTRAEAIRRDEGVNDLRFYFGQTILNSDVSETSDAYELSYHRRISPHWAWSASYVNEGSPERLRRDGLSLQAWLEGFFLDRRLRLGVGAGPYATWVEHYGGKGPDRDDARLSARISLEVGWRLGNQWTSYFTWNRTATSYHRDTDVLSAGVGFDW